MACNQLILRNTRWRHTERALAVNYGLGTNTHATTGDGNTKRTHARTRKKNIPAHNPNIDILARTHKRGKGLLCARLLPAVRRGDSPLPASSSSSGRNCYRCNRRAISCVCVCVCSQNFVAEHIFNARTHSSSAAVNMPAQPEHMLGEYVCRKGNYNNPISHCAGAPSVWVNYGVNQRRSTFGLGFICY